MTHAEFKKRFLPLQSMLSREAYRLLCDKFEAEDAVQNLYMKLWEQREELKSLVSPEAYCKKILKNICIDRWRYLKMREDDVLVNDEILACDNPPDVEVRESERCIEDFIRRLPDLQRRVMEMRMQGCDFGEIESVTGLSAVNIRVIVSRVRKRIRELYNKM